MKKTIIITISVLALIASGFLLGRLTNDSSMPFLNDDEVIDERGLNENEEIEEDNSENGSQFNSETGDNPDHDHSSDESEIDENPNEPNEPEENDDEYYKN